MGDLALDFDRHVIASAEVGVEPRSQHLRQHADYVATAARKRARTPSGIGRHTGRSRICSTKSNMSSSMRWPWARNARQSDGSRLPPGWGWYSCSTWATGFLMMLLSARVSHEHFQESPARYAPDFVGGRARAPATQGSGKFLRSVNKEGKQSPNA